MFQKNLLEAQMKAYSDNGATLAAALGIARSTLSAKLNEYNGAEFTNSEIALIKKRYSLSPDQIDRIFFYSESV